jgi:Txe/YoeB family toxin of Txe-Axe toxin-antitoxin module
MNFNYDLLVRHEVYLVLKRARKKDQHQIIEYIEALPNDPFQSGDSFFHKENGRRYEAKILGKFRIVYWVDHSEKEVRVVDLLDSD